MEAKPSLIKRPGILLLIIGVIIPLITVAVELATDFCAEVFFDPIPTVGHKLLAAFVPLANMFVWLALRESRREYASVLTLINGIAIGVAAFYTVLFAPITPIALIALVYFGLGLLPLTPLLSLIAAIVLARRLRKMIETRARINIWLGILATAVLLVAIELPMAFTLLGMQWAKSEDASTRQRGLNYLRTFGVEQQMLRACYVRPQQVTDLLSFLLSVSDPVMPEEARIIYYRVTGRVFNSVPPPKLKGSERWESEDYFEFDSAQGTETVGKRIKGLSLASSRIDSSIDGGGALSYTEWTMEFKNDTHRQQEARTKILLPPGGVVSRLTLWVNGEEREAAFAGRGKVKEAYQNVVRQRRDPVLVTTCGPDRVMVQCFPVPAQGEMKIRFGITAPLKLESLTQGLYKLPVFIERNFTVSDSPVHNVWIASKTGIETKAPGFTSESSAAQEQVLRGQIKDSDLSRTIVRAHTTGVANAWAADSVSKEKRFIRQTIEKSTEALPLDLVVVVDGSASMQKHLTDIAEALKQLPDSIQLTVLIAGDEIVRLVESRDLTVNAIAENLKTYKARGGCDNIPALTQGFYIAAQSKPGAMVWVHGPQPLLLSSPDQLIQAMERNGIAPRVYEVTASNGADLISEKLYAFSTYSGVERFSTLAEDLGKFFQSLGGTATKLAYRREVISELNAALDTNETSNHLARLWAVDEVKRLLAANDKKKVDEAIQLAAAYQLVTPVTGAVVLETQQQYKDAGLEPVDSGSVPTIPEPEQWMLIIVASMMMAWIIYKQRVARAPR